MRPLGDRKRASGDEAPGLLLAVEGRGAATDGKGKSRAEGAWGPLAVDGERQVMKSTRAASRRAGRGAAVFLWLWAVAKARLSAAASYDRVLVAAARRVTAAEPSTPVGVMHLVAWVIIC